MRKIEPFDTYTMPISGTDFVRYIAAVSFLASYRRKRNLPPFRPKIIYAASGGCLIAYLAMMSSFTERIEDWMISSDMFLNRPTPITPRLLTFSLRGFLYHRVDLTDYIAQNFVPCKVQDVEIITGYYEMENPTTYQSTVKIVSNMPVSRSSLAGHTPRLPNVVVVHPSEEQSIDPLSSGETLEASVALSRRTKKAYLDEVMALVIDALHKTSNIPYMMEPLGESAAVDYGVVAPSPRVAIDGKSDRSIYFSPVDIDRTGLIQGADMIYHKTIMNDIVSLRNTFQSSQRFDGANAEESLTNALACLADKVRYCLVVYSTASLDIPIAHFTDVMVKSYVGACKGTMRFLLLFDLV